MTPYEKMTQTEFIRWQNEKEGWLSKALGLVTKPVEWVYEEIIPDVVTNAVNKAIMDFVELLKDGAFWTFSDSEIIKEAEKQDITINKITDLRSCDMDKLDKIAQSYFMSNKMIATLEGAGCGLGGLTLIVADIPALFTIAFRAVQQIGSSYGFEMNDPRMTPIVLEIFNAATAASAASKSTAIADMRIAVEAYAKSWSYKKSTEKTRTRVNTTGLKERVKILPKKITDYIIKRKLVQAIPLLGVGVGAGFNYWFLSSICKAAYMLFRELHITTKYQMNSNVTRK